MSASVLYRFRFLYLFVLLGAVPFAYKTLYPTILEVWFTTTSDHPPELIALRRTGLIVADSEDCPDYGIGIDPSFSHGSTFLFTEDGQKMCGCVYLDNARDQEVLSRVNQDGSVSFLCGTKVITLRINSRR